MRKAALFFNPLSGRRRQKRVADVEAALAVLREGGLEVYGKPTLGPAAAGEQAREAIAGGCDTIFACGGDGTVNDVLQGLVGTDAALGVIPLGTANALAHDLRLPFSAAAAAGAALTGQPRRIAVGRVEYRNFDGGSGSRYFTVAAGVGVDAHLFYKLNMLIKGRLGMAAYYFQAMRLWLTHRMQNFAVEVGENRYDDVSQLLAVRIRNFGGILRELAPGADLARNDLRLVFCRTTSRVAYLRYVFRGWVGSQKQVKGIELCDANAVLCRPISAVVQPRIYVEADGELLGTLPADISVVPDALTLLVPAKVAANVPAKTT
ncbi:MAG TPA: YegS/Rv2252/BmrU family lipid kinase [Terriglobales bacterium]|nr:YegS/Rv2252/BmrU family lipid kinase [Terriglobales bacterium]